jgi:predicted phage-related endonuclease
MALSPEQLAMRSTGIGGSECPILADVDLYGRTRWYLYGLKTGLFPPLPPDESMELGNYLEAGVLAYYQRKHGVELAPGKMTTLRHPERPWQFATPDGLVLEGGVPVRNVQVKCVAGWKRDLFGPGPEDVPEGMRCQVEWEMDVLGVRATDLVVLVGGSELLVKRIDRRPALAGALVELGRAFWFDHVEPRNPPPLDGSSHASRGLAAKYRQPRSPILERDSDPEVDRWARRYWAASVVRKGAEFEQDRAAQELQAIVGDLAGIKTPQATVTWEARQGRIDWKAVAHETGVDLARAEKLRSLPTRQFGVKYSPDEVTEGMGEGEKTRLALAILEESDDDDDGR